MHRLSNVLAGICLLILSASAFAAQTPQEQLQDFADALQSGDAPAALSFVDPQAGQYADLRRAIETIASLPHTECSLEIGRARVEGNEATLDATSTLRLSPGENRPLVIRKDQVFVKMRRVGPDWKIDSLSPLAIFSRPGTAVFDVIANLATNLSAGDTADALAAFDSGARDYGRIANDIEGLITQADVLCAIDIVADNESNGIHRIDTDWYLEIKPKADGAGAQRRRERVLLQLEIRRGKYRITVMSPPSVVSPVL